MLNDSIHVYVYGRIKSCKYTCIVNIQIKIYAEKSIFFQNIFENNVMEDDCPEQLPIIFDLEFFGVKRSCNMRLENCEVELYHVLVT